MLTLEAKKAALEAIERENGGRLEPQMVVDAARSPSHPLHSLFDWNDEAAANAHRVTMARAIIREVQIVIERRDVAITTVAYVRDPRAEAKSPGYVRLSAAAQRKADARAIMENELTRIRAAIERARAIATVLNLEGELERLLKQTIEIEKKVEAEPEPKLPQRRGRRRGEYRPTA